MGKTASLSRIVEGVEFTVHDGLVTIRALILRDALEAFFGANEHPSSWLQAYLENRGTIDKAAADRYRTGLGPPLTILSVGHWAASVTPDRGRPRPRDEPAAAPFTACRKNADLMRRE